jgi:predicted amidohydrolase
MKVGFIQNNPKFGEAEANFERMKSLWGSLSAELIVLPELFATGYQFSSQQEAKELAEPIPEGSTTQKLMSWAKEINSSLVAGIAEIDGNKLFNSAVIISPDGYVGTYRKAHVFDTENKYFSQGDLPIKVFELAGIRVGVMICFDWRFPETARTLALRGADIIAHPSNLVLPHCPDAMITRCLENRVFAITADRVGFERRVQEETLNFIGKSQVISPDGDILYRASETEEEVSVIEIDIGLSRKKKINSKNDLFEGRRLDLYELS